MFSKIFRRKGNRDGSTLILVLIVFTVLMLLGMAALTASTVATKVTASTAAKQQADFIAQSAVKSAMSYIQSNTSVQGTISGLTTGGSVSGNVNFSAKGVTQNPTITVQYYNANTVKVIAKSQYSGPNGGLVSGQAVAYLTKSAGTDNSIKPFDNLIYFNGNGSLGQCNLTGNVVSDGSFSYGNGSYINGTLLANGNVTLSGYASGLTGVKALGDVTITGSGTITNGDVYATGSLYLSGSGTVNGNVYISHNGSLSNGYISNSAFFGGTADFSGGGNRIGGNLTVGTSYTYAWGTIGSFVTGTATVNPSIPPVVINFNRPNLSPVSAPSGYNTVTIGSNMFSSSNTYTISNNCVLNSGSPSGYSTYTVNFDTSTKDINVVIDSAFSLPSNVRLLVSGPNRLFIYLVNANSSFSITGGNSVLMMKDNFNSNTLDEQPQIFIMGDGSANQGVTLSSDSRMDGYIYLPNGTFTAGGSNSYNYKLFGSVCAGSASIDSSVNIKYIAPINLTGTPLAGKASGSTNSSGSSWSLSGWSSQ